MSERRPLVEGLKPRPESDRILEEQFVYGKRAQKPAEPSSTKVSRPTRPNVSQAEPAPESPRAEPVATSSREENTNPATVTRPAATISRVPFTTRLRSDMAQALKRASLERQLEGVEPNTVQEILEHALEPWLRANGYLT